LYDGTESGVKALDMIGNATRAAFNIAEAARYVGLGETRFRELLRSKAISARRYGRRVIIAKAELDKWLSEIR
jgi:excisionase family DNA binding protein